VPQILSSCSRRNVDVYSRSLIRIKINLKVQNRGYELLTTLVNLS